MKKTSRRAARRLTQKEMTAQLETLFTENSEQKFSTRDIFSALGCSTHPQRVLCCDILEDMVDADVITVKDGLYSLCLKNQVIEGRFVRKPNGHNSVVPDDGGKSILVTERNSAGAMNGDRVRATILARRKKHAREAQVTEVLKRAR